MLEYLTAATVSNSTFWNNDGGIEGGAIFSYYCDLKVVNSIFVNNHALAYTGAIHAFYGNTILTNNTFTGNAAALSGGYGGAILNNWGTVTFRNNLFVNNSATNGPNCDNSGGTFNYDGGNLVWGSDDCPGVNANPLLGTLGDYTGGLRPSPYFLDLRRSTRPVRIVLPLTNGALRAVQPATAAHSSHRALH